MKISSALLKCDQICDRIPIVSSISNAVDLFQKAVMSSINPSTKNRYFSHIKNKKNERCLILIILPVVGNVIFALKDLKQKRNDDAIAQNEKKANELSQKRNDDAIAESEKKANELKQCLDTYLSTLNIAFENFTDVDQDQDAVLNDLFTVIKPIPEFETKHKKMDYLWDNIKLNDEFFKINLSVDSDDQHVKNQKEEILEARDCLLNFRRTTYALQLLTLSEEELLQEALKYYFLRTSAQNIDASEIKDAKNLIPLMQESLKNLTDFESVELVELIAELKREAKS